MDSRLERRCTIALQAYGRATGHVAERAGDKPVEGADASDITALLARAGALAMQNDGRQQTDGLPALQSIMGHLHQGAQDCYYGPQLLDTVEQVLMPGEQPKDLIATYRKLWQQMRHEIHGLDRLAATEAREAGYLGLMQRFTWAMPAPGVHDTDVSMYDFVRVQAALAVCLDEQPQVGDAVALLVGGDLSGVQDWLYTIGSEGAARSLRGRSVYLQLLSEIVAQWLLDSLALPSCNLLYAGGGNFYVLAPVSAEAELGRLQIELTQRLLKMHGGALYVALGSTQLTEELLKQRVGHAWEQAHQAMSRRKQQRFAELDDDLAMSAVIGSALPGTGKLTDSCRVCRRTISDGEKTHSVDDADGGRVCQLCTSFETLGNQLPHAEFLVLSRLARSETNQQVLDWRAGLRQFGYDVQFAAHAQSERGAWKPVESDLVRIFFWKQEQPELTSFPGMPELATTVWLFRPLAQATPLHYTNRGEQIATFEELKSEGVDRWAVLRMDVDRLGALFRDGIPDASLSRVVGVSGMLRLFFEGYVPRLADALNSQEHPSVYLMYAGGDDLFVVGGWSHLPGLAWQIREALRKFAAGNKKLTISAGISLALSERYPIYQAAQDAGEAEEMAKREGRNRIAFLGQAVEWEGQSQANFQAVHRRVQEIADWLTKHNLNRSFLMRLREIDVEMRAWQKHERVAAQARYKHSNKKLYLGPWQWHLVYSLQRATERVKDDDVKSSVTRFIGNIVPQEIEVLGLESRWAELLTRKKDGDK